MGGAFFSGEIPVMFIILKFVFVMMFLVSAVSKILSFNQTLVYLAGIIMISLPILTILLWILITIELVVSAVVWIEGYQSKMIFGSIQFLLFAFLITNILFFLYGIENCGCFGADTQSYPIVGVLKTMLLMIILSYLRTNSVNPIDVSSSGIRG